MTPTEICDRIFELVDQNNDGTWVTCAHLCHYKTVFEVVVGHAGVFTHIAVFVIEENTLLSIIKHSESWWSQQCIGNYAVACSKLLEFVLN